MTGAKSKQLALGVIGRFCKALKAIARGKVKKEEEKIRRQLVVGCGEREWGWNQLLWGMRIGGSANSFLSLVSLSW